MTGRAVARTHRGIRAGALALGALLLASAPAASEPGRIAGTATVIDGDAIEIAGRAIRLHGIDAPAHAQLCLDGMGLPWRCGHQASVVLAERIEGAALACRPTGEDRSGRTVAVCFDGAVDLGAWMVAQGWAVADRDRPADYGTLERAAEAAGRGLWSSEFLMPWDWRQSRRVAAREASPHAEGCAIKGHVGPDGERVYHLPGDRWYEQTRIDESRGHRWLCSEEEARASGWRRSRR
jgi:endonuclease YncB( thermonuclease family)